MSEAQTRKIAPHHLEREACLYVRQSSLRQVMRNTESTRRQYGLRQRATALGWPMERIRVIDEDQGKSGAYSENRIGFRDLMGSIAAGEVGIVLGLEVSRLARDNADWHQLLRIAGITNTLILDETGIYDPNDSNDRLLLGMKGTMSEFELLGIKARLLGGQRNAAARGALKIRLPTGLAYNDKNEVVFDPDRSVVDAIRLVFDSFRRLGSAKGVAKWMQRENIGAAVTAAKRAALRRAALGASAGAPNRPHSEKSALRRRLCLWPIARRAAGGRDRKMPRRADGELARLHPGRPCGLHRLGGVPSQSSHPERQCCILPGIARAHRGAARGGGAVAVAGDLRPLRSAHEHAVQQRTSASQPAGALLLHLQHRVEPLRTEDLPEHARRSRRRRDIALRDRRVEPREHRSCPGGPAAGRCGVRRGRCSARQTHRGHPLRGRRGAAQVLRGRPGKPASGGIAGSGLERAPARSGRGLPGARGPRRSAGYRALRAAGRTHPGTGAGLRADMERRRDRKRGSQAVARAAGRGCDADPGRLRGDDRPAHARGTFPDAGAPSTAETDGGDPQDTCGNGRRGRPVARNSR